MPVSCSKLIENGADVVLSEALTKADGAYTAPLDAWQIALLYGIHEELKRLNRLLSCPNFIGIPQTLRAIERNTKKPRKPRRRVPKRPVIARDKNGRAFYNKQGPKLKLTALQVVELVAWMKAKRHDEAEHQAAHARTFGTLEEKAKALGVSVDTLRIYLRRAASSRA